jgi:general secretion pathway protein E
LVLSTVHTNSAAATVTRLLDMGVEDYLLASSLKGVLAQRLVRKLCPACSVVLEPTDAEAARLLRLAGRPSDEATVQMREPCGCAACQGTGYRGRTAIYELLTVTPALRDIIAGSVQESGLEAAAVSAGMTTLLQSGMAKVLAGETSLQEVLRVTRAADAALPL